MSRSWLAAVLLFVMPMSVVNAADISDDVLPEPLVALDRIQLDAVQGRAVFAEREQGHCVLCHAVDGLDVPFQGDVGPTMSGIGSRLTPAQIRYRIVDASQLNPDTIMPPYYRTEGLKQVSEDYVGETVLSAEQIEQLVFYLASLRD